MAKAAKIGLALIIAAIMVLAALTVAVKLILTPDRLIPLVEKEAREALGRQVTIGGLYIGLLSGIEVRDLEIKGEDPKQEFARIGTFRLRYDLWRVLHKELVSRTWRSKIRHSPSGAGGRLQLRDPSSADKGGPEDGTRTREGFFQADDAAGLAKHREILHKES